MIFCWIFGHKYAEGWMGGPTQNMDWWRCCLRCDHLHSVQVMETEKKVGFR